MRSVLLVAVVACTPPTASPPVAQPRATALPETVAAGIYWMPYKTCADCEAPAALAAYVVEDAGAARAIASRLDGTLGLGLPFVVHAEEIGLGRDAIVVAVGAYARRADAEAAARAAPAIAGRRAEVVEVPGGDTFGEVRHHVVRIDRGERVPAWSRADVEAVDAEADGSTDPAVHHTEASRRRWIAERLHAREPACTVAAGELFVVEEAELKWYEYAPVRCGTAPAYVAWTSSLLGHAAVVRDGTGYVLRQVVGAQCDSPIIESWRYDEHGRRRAPAEPPAVVAGC